MKRHLAIFSAILMLAASVPAIAHPGSGGGGGGGHSGGSGGGHSGGGGYHGGGGGGGYAHGSGLGTGGAAHAGFAHAGGASGAHFAHAGGFTHGGAAGHEGFREHHATTMAQNQTNHNNDADYAAYNRFGPDGIGCLHLDPQKIGQDNLNCGMPSKTRTR